MYATNFLTNAGTNGIIGVYGVSNSSWTEGGLKYSNAPALDATPIQTVAVPAISQYYNADVTDYVKAQLAAGHTVFTLAFAGMNTQSHEMQFSARTTTNGNPPRITILTESPDAAAAVRVDRTALIAALNGTNTLLAGTPVGPAAGNVPQEAHDALAAAIVAAAEVSNSIHPPRARWMHRRRRLPKLLPPSVALSSQNPRRRSVLCLYRICLWRQ